MKENDPVCVLYGGRLPFLLRPKNDFYHLVGECYVHGTTDGEAITMLEAGSFQKRVSRSTKIQHPIALHLGSLHQIVKRGKAQDLAFSEYSPKSL